LQALSWRPEPMDAILRAVTLRDARLLPLEVQQVAGAIRTYLRRPVDVNTGRPLTVAELRRRLAAAGFNEGQVAREVALAIEKGEVTNEKAVWVMKC